MNCLPFAHTANQPICPFTWITPLNRFSWKNRKLTKHVWAVFAAQKFHSFWLLLVTSCKEMQIAYTAQIINQLFHLLNLAYTYGDAFYGLIPMLMSKNVSIDVSKDSPFHTFQLPLFRRSYLPDHRSHFLLIRRTEDKSPRSLPCLLDQERDEHHHRIHSRHLLSLDTRNKI